MFKINEENYELVGSTDPRFNKVLTQIHYLDIKQQRPRIKKAKFRY